MDTMQLWWIGFHSPWTYKLRFLTNVFENKLIKVAVAGQLYCVAVTCTALHVMSLKRNKIKCVGLFPISISPWSLIWSCSIFIARRWLLRIESKLLENSLANAVVRSLYLPIGSSCRNCTYSISCVIRVFFSHWTRLE